LSEHPVDRPWVPRDSSRNPFDRLDEPAVAQGEVEAGAVTEFMEFERTSDRTDMVKFLSKGQATTAQSLGWEMVLGCLEVFDAAVVTGAPMEVTPVDIEAGTGDKLLDLLAELAISQMGLNSAEKQASD